MSTIAPRLAVVIVAYNSADALERSLPALAGELVAGDEVIVVDNASRDGSAQVARRLLPDAQVVESGANIGFPAGCNAGARRATADLLLFLNPDAVPAPGFGAAIRAPWTQTAWVGWQALVTADDGATVNTAGNVVHATGIAWAGQAGVHVADADLHEREVPYLSGACMAVRRAAFEAAGGFDEWLFLYHEDLDLSLRLRQAGGRLGLAPGARVDHDYEFVKGGYKWRLMERNRWAVVVRLWPGPVLLAAAPLLLAAEPAIWLTAWRDGWAGEKRRAAREALRALPRLLGERRELRRRRRIGAGEFADWLSPTLSSAYLGPVARNRTLNALLAAYWRLARLGLRGG